MEFCGTSIKQIKFKWKILINSAIHESAYVLGVVNPYAEKIPKSVQQAFVKAKKANIELSKNKKCSNN